MLKILIALIVVVFVEGLAKAEHYCLVFSSQSTKGAKPAMSHVFATFVEAKDQKVVKEFTISWGPTADHQPYHLGDGVVPGNNRSLRESIEKPLEDMVEPQRVDCWGPFLISQKWYENAEHQYDLLERGVIKYQAMDRVTRADGGDVKNRAINCIHAASDIAGELVTRGKYGDRACEAIVEHYRKQGVIEKDVTDKKWLLDGLAIEHYKIIYH